MKVYIWALLGLFGVAFLGSEVDLLLNPWVRTAHFKWWNLFTTKHYFSWLMVHHFELWFLLILFSYGIMVFLISFVGGSRRD